jgi:HlyD family secretion protein
LKKHGLLWLGVAILAAAALYFGLMRPSANTEATAFRFANVERTRIESAVTATGKLQPVTTVQVGTQISGQVANINVDFNAHVKKGQLIARIDPTLLQQAVAEAQANIERGRAELAQAEADDVRNRQLFERKLVSEMDFSSTKYKAAVARASLKSAQVALSRARRNLSYAEIYAPIDGVVIERNVDVGQTVAANFSAPQLFLIANNLSKMQILAAVDQADIGQIRQGQDVRFTVQAYPDEKFTASVQQVRLQSAVQENVVNYTVVVALDNASGRLLPGMTATLEFLTAIAEDTLAIPNTALRFRPSPEMLAAAGIDAKKWSRPAGMDDSSRANGLGRSAANRGPAAGRMAMSALGGQATLASRQVKKPGEQAVIWHLRDDKLEPVSIRVGISDGQKTAIQATAIQEGAQVIVGLVQPMPAGGAATNPFQPQAAPRGPGGF